MEQHFPKFLRKRTTSRGQLCVESFSHRVKFTSLCSYTSFPPRVVCVDGNKVRKNCNKNGDSYAGISCCFFFWVLLCANFYNQIRTKFFGSITVSRKLPTYPSPKPSFCPKWEVSVHVNLGEGSLAVSQNPKLIQFFFSALKSLY